MVYDAPAIIALRARLNLTQSQLAEEIGVDRSNISRWENGTTKPRGSAVKLLAGLAAKRPVPLPKTRGSNAGVAAS